MVILRGIPNIISPDLLYVLAKMGHGDEIVLADANFPTSSVCRFGPTEIRVDGLGIPELLQAILKLFPLDTYVNYPAAVMDLVKEGPPDSNLGQVPGIIVKCWLCITDSCWGTARQVPAGFRSGDLQPAELTAKIASYFVIISKTFIRMGKPLEKVERFAFYERAKKSFAVVATGETALYGNLILTKGVIPAGENGE